MDQETKQRIVEIVNSMNAQGMSQTEIKENLSQMGLEENDVNEILSNSTPKINVAEIHDQVKQTKDLLESGKHLEPVLNKIDDQQEHFERLHTKVNDLHEKHDVSSTDLSSLKKDVAELKQYASENKALLSAIKRLNENLLNINKKMLLKFGSQ